MQKPNKRGSVIKWKRSTIQEVAQCPECGSESFTVVRSTDDVDDFTETKLECTECDFFSII